MVDAYRNLALSSVAVSPGSAGTSLTVLTGHGTRFPVPPWNGTIWPLSKLPDPLNAEIIRVTAITGDVLTILRGQEGTTPRNVQVGDLIANTITKDLLDQLYPPFRDLIEGNYPNPIPDTARLFALDVNGYTQVEMKDSAGHGARFSSDNIVIAKITEPTGISRGQPVYIDGASGANSLVRLARSDSISTMPAIGIVLDAGPANAFTRVLTSGTLQVVDTSAFVEGVSLFVSPTVAGGFTSTYPADPNYAQRVGFVTRSHATQGEILVLTTGVVTNPRLHAPTHGVGGTDPVDVKALGGYPGGSATFLRSDATFASPPGGGGTGDVTGPASATDNAVVLYDGATGKLIKDSSFINVNGSLQFTTLNSSLIFPTGGVPSAPTFGTRSTGTRIVIYPVIGPGLADYAFGIQGAVLWSGTPGQGEHFKWFHGITETMDLNSNGRLTAIAGFSGILVGDVPSQFTRRDVSETISSFWRFGGGLMAGTSTPYLELTAGDDATARSWPWTRGNMSYLVLNAPGGLYLNQDTAAAVLIGGGGGTTTVQAALTVNGGLTAANNCNFGSVFIYGGDIATFPGRPWMRGNTGHLVINSAPGWGLHFNLDSGGPTTVAGSGLTVSGTLGVTGTSTFGTTQHNGGATFSAETNLAAHVSFGTGMSGAGGAYIDMNGRVIMRAVANYSNEIRFWDDSTSRGVYFCVPAGAGCGMSGTSAAVATHIGQIYNMRYRCHSTEAHVFENHDGSALVGIRGSDGLLSTHSIWPRGQSTYTLGQGDYTAANAWKWGGIAIAAPAISSGYVTLATDGSGWIFYVSSAAETKKDIEPLRLEEAKNVLGKLLPVRYRDAKAPNAPLIAGYLAEDVESAGLTDLVSYYEGKLAGVHYDRIAIYLAMIAKDMDARLRALESREA